MTRNSLAKALILAGVLWTVALTCAACGSIDSVFTVIDAVLAGIGPVLVIVGTAISPAASAAITAAVSVVQGASQALQAAIDDYLNDSTGDTTLLQEVQDAIQALQQSLQQLLSAAHIDNTTLQNWISALVNAISSGITTVTNALMPAAESGLLKTDLATQESAKDTAQLVREEIISNVDVATAQSGLPADAISKFHGQFHHAIGHHIGLVPLP